MRLHILICRGGLGGSALGFTDRRSLRMVTLLTGRLALPAVMTHLASRRPVFHSEADFQFAFAQSVAQLDERVGIRLEVPVRGGHRRTYVDLVCRASQQVSLVEFKYVTRSWSGTDGHTDELFDLRSHEALDLARLSFIHDVTRLEGWAAEQVCSNGVAVLLTNDGRLWDHPAPGKTTRDHRYRLHEGQTLTGPLTWGTPDAPFEANDRQLRGSYEVKWQEYSHQDDGPGGKLRWLGWAVTA